MANIVDMEFAMKLKMLCARTDTTQRRLAELLTQAGMETSKSTVSLWFKGEYTPDLSRAQWIARHFGVAVEYLANPDVTEPSQVFMSADEREVLGTFRSLGLKKEAAVKRLMRGGSSLPPEGEGYGDEAEDDKSAKNRNKRASK